MFKNKSSRLPLIYYNIMKGRSVECALKKAGYIHSAIVSWEEEKHSRVFLNMEICDG